MHKDLNLYASFAAGIDAGVQNQDSGGISRVPIASLDPESYSKHNQIQTMVKNPDPAGFQALCVSH